MIACPRGIVRAFERFALARYPRESYVVLLGHQRGRYIRVRDTWYPEDQSRYSTTTGLYCDVWTSPWRERAEDIAASSGLCVVGDIHSHTQRVRRAREIVLDAVPSETDLLCRRRLPRPAVMGVTVVAVAPRQRIVRTRLWLLVPHDVVARGP